MIWASQSTIDRSRIIGPLEATHGFSKNGEASNCNVIRNLGNIIQRNGLQMKGEVLKIIFKDGMAFLTKEVALDFNQVDVPADSKFKTPAYWVIRVINYNTNEKRLFVEVLEYHVGATQFSPRQIELNDTLMEIEKVGFKSIDTPGWLNTSNGTRPGKFLPTKAETVYRSEPVLRVQVKRVYEDPFSIAIKDVTFVAGKVTFEKKIQPLGKIVKFEIANDEIIEQYDAIKNYFENVLKTKRIQVVPVISTTDGEIDSVSATSEEISKINKSLIEEVKIEMLRVAEKKEVPGENQLFTMKEYLETFVDENTQQFFKDENDFLETLLKRPGTKHHFHLRWLSSKHKHDLEKLRLVHKPFSYVFLLDNTDNFFIVWETLDTEEATFIWKFKKNSMTTDQILAETNKVINLIEKDGRNEYRARLESNFGRLVHDYQDPQGGFKSWKEKMEKIIK